MEEEKNSCSNCLLLCRIYSFIFAQLHGGDNVKGIAKVLPEIAVHLEDSVIQCISAALISVQPEIFGKFQKFKHLLVQSVENHAYPKIFIYTIHS